MTIPFERKTWNRTTQDWDVYEVEPDANFRSLAAAAIDLVAEWHAPFAKQRPGVQLRFWTRAAFPFEESLAALTGEPFPAFTVDRTWTGLVHSAQPRTIWLSAQMQPEEVLETVGHEVRHLLQLASRPVCPDEADQQAREADARRFAASFVIWCDVLALDHDDEGAA